MANPSRGRPRLSGEEKFLRLRSSVYDLWNERKSSLGFDGITNSEFAKFFLHLPLEQHTRYVEQPAFLVHYRYRYLLHINNNSVAPIPDELPRDDEQPFISSTPLPKQ